MCLINLKQEMTMGNSWREILLRACWKSVLCARERREKGKEDVGYRGRRKKGRKKGRRGRGGEGEKRGSYMQLRKGERGEKG